MARRLARSRRSVLRACACSVAATLAALTPSAAHAAVSCAKINKNPVVYVTGTAVNYLSALARALFVDSTPITIVWVGNSSCVALDAVLHGTPLSGSASYWDPTSTASNGQVSCDLPSADTGAGVTTDIGIADVFADTCGSLPNGLPGGVGDFQGPVQSMSFVVPKASQQQAISATAAYYVFGLGGGSGVAPWTKDADILRMSEASGTQLMIGAAINVPAVKWKGTNVGYSSVMISQLTSASSSSANSTIGILATSNITATLATQMSVLAYKHYGQSCAYYPDSSSSSHDKRNVRDGHYAIWGPIHIFTKIDSKGYPVSAHAQRVIDYLTGVTPPPGGLDLIQVAATNNLVPSCAMQVKRQTEMGPVSAFTPSSPCSCAFEYSATGATSCKACTTSTSCPTSSPVCSFGYCEQQ